MKKNPKVLFIDWHQTLSYSSFWSQLDDPKHPYSVYYPLIQRWLFRDNIPLVDRWMRGAITYPEICGMVAAANGLEADVVRDTLEQSAAAMELCSDEVRSLIANIRNQGVKVILATDNMDTFSKITVRNLSLDRLFDGILVSSERGCLKYEVNDDSIPFFDPFLRAHNFAYAEAVLLDDSEDRSGTYQRLGFKITAIKNPAHLIEELRKYSN